jgi:microcystin-dependent protein
MEPFLGEIRMFAFPFEPKGWKFCDGQTITISSEAALYSLLGAQFGSDQRTYFKLPDLRGRVPIGISDTYEQGAFGGVETVTLTEAEMGRHTHEFQGTSDDGEKLNAASGESYLASVVDRGTSDPGVELYGNATDLVDLAPCISSVGGGQAHNNMQPSTVVNYCISFSGTYPARN